MRMTRIAPSMGNPSFRDGETIVVSALLGSANIRRKKSGMSNAALFSTVAREYASFRPGYPPELFAWLARVSPACDAVWDCGCGSGQASTALAEHFTVVYATDIASEQIAAA